MEARLTALRVNLTSHFGIKFPAVTFRLDERRLPPGGYCVVVYDAPVAAGAVSFFCSPDSDYVSGQVLVCGGGYQMTRSRGVDKEDHMGP